MTQTGCLVAEKVQLLTDGSLCFFEVEIRPGTTERFLGKSTWHINANTRLKFCLNMHQSGRQMRRANTRQ